MAEAINDAPDYCRKAILVLGCGHVLLGDDGFGPEVVTYLESHYPIPEDVALVDVGTGVGEVLLDLALSPQKPKRILLVDVLDGGQPAGTSRPYPWRPWMIRPCAPYGTPKGVLSPRATWESG